ncbi:MAG: hypothetical protein ACOY40_14960 [Bacillota bacterium]
MGSKGANDKYIPPTYMHNLKHQLVKKGRADVNERDKRLLRYIRSLQESRQKSGIFRFL